MINGFFRTMIECHGKNAKHIQMLWLLFFDNLQSHCPMRAFGIHSIVWYSHIFAKVWRWSWFGTEASMEHSADMRNRITSRCFYDERYILIRKINIDAELMSRRESEGRLKHSSLYYVVLNEFYLLEKNVMWATADMLFGRIKMNEHMAGNGFACDEN